MGSRFTYMKLNFQYVHIGNSISQDVHIEKFELQICRIELDICEIQFDICENGFEICT
jgi:hypothetical protein